MGCMSRSTVLKALAVIFAVTAIASAIGISAYAEDTVCTLYSPTSFPCKFEISAPAQVDVGESFEMRFKWSEYEFDTCVSAFAVQFAFDTRYIVLETATESDVTIVGKNGAWTDASNYGGVIGLGAVEAENKSVANMVTVSISFFNEESLICLEDEFIVKLNFKAVHSGTPAFDWQFMELYDEYFEYEVVSHLEDASISISVAEDEAQPEDGIKGDVNGDGKTDNLDAALVLRHDAMLYTIDSHRLSYADVNGDGDVNSLDAAAILRYDAGIIDRL